MPTNIRAKFCAVCGAVEAILPRELVTPDSGSALMCEQCWADYCEQTGARRELPKQGAKGRQRGGIIRQSGARCRECGAEIPAAEVEECRDLPDSYLCLACAYIPDNYRCRYDP